MRHADITNPLDLHEPKPHARSHNSVDLLGNQDPLTLDGSQLTTGIVPTARLGSGTASVNTYLRGDQVWAVAPAGGGVFPGLISGRYYDTSFSVSVTQASSGTRTADTIYGVPIYIPGTYTMNQIACQIATGGAGGTLLRLGIYSAAATGLPATLLVDGGAIAADVTGLRTATLSLALAEAWYWLAFLSNGGPSTYGFTASQVDVFGQTSLSATAGLYCVTASQTYGSLPGTFPAVTYASAGPKIALRVA